MNIPSKQIIDDKLLAAVVYFTQDSIIITSNDLNPPGPKIVYVNPGFTRMTGYLSEEVLGKTPRILQGPKTDVAVLKRLRQNLEKGENFFGQSINYRKDGSEFWNEWHIEAINAADGKSQYYVAIQRDITVRKNNEIAIEQKNAALREVLEHIQIEKQKIKENVGYNVREVILPALKKLRAKSVGSNKKLIDIMEKSLTELTDDFGFKVSEKKAKLSPREIEIAHLIKQGVASKEISTLLNISFKTVETHRNRIRKKFGIVNKDFNLTSYLKDI